MLLLDSKPITVAEPTLAKISGLQSQNCKRWAEMRSTSHARINTRELKTQIVKKIGAKRAERYFSHIRKFLTSHLSKEMLDKLVLITIGRENVALHNQLIKSILTNAVLCCQAPPDAIRSVDDGVSNQITDNGPSHSSDFHTLPKSDVPLPSPHCGMSNRLLDQHYGEGKDVLITSQKEHAICKQRKHSETKQILQYEDEPMISDKRLKECDAFSEKIPERFSSSAFEAPLGIVFCKNAGDKRCSFLQPVPAHLLVQNVTGEELLDGVSLPDSRIMHKIMEQIAAAEGLDGTGSDCAELLNRALDSYLKRLITSCVDFVRSQNGKANDQKPVRNFTSRGTNDLDGLYTRSGHLKDPPSADLLQSEKNEPNTTLSLTDFKMAMEVMSHQLGASWPVQLEKISSRIYDH